MSSTCAMARSINAGQGIAVLIVDSNVSKCSYTEKLSNWVIVGVETENRELDTNTSPKLVKRKCNEHKMRVILGDFSSTYQHIQANSK